MSNTRVLASLGLPTLRGGQNRGGSRRDSVDLQVDVRFSPCSVIMTGGTVSPMLARRDRPSSRCPALAGNHGVRHRSETAEAFAIQQLTFAVYPVRAT